MISIIRQFHFIVIVFSIISFSNNAYSQKYLGLDIELLELNDSNVTALTPNEIFDDFWIKPNVSVPNLGNSNTWIWARLNLDPVKDAGLHFSNLKIIHPNNSTLTLLILKSELSY